MIVSIHVQMWSTTRQNSSLQELSPQETDERKRKKKFSKMARMCTTLCWDLLKTKTPKEREEALSWIWQLCKDLPPGITLKSKLGLTLPMVCFYIILISICINCSFFLVCTCWFHFECLQRNLFSVSFQSYHSFLCFFLGVCEHALGL